MARIQFVFSLAFLVLPSCVHATAKASTSATASVDAPLLTVELGRLNWGRNPATGIKWTIADLRSALSPANTSDLGRQLRRIVSKSQETLGETVTPIAKLESEGLLSDDPRYIASGAAVAPLRDVATWALCARIAAEPIRSQCQDKVLAVITNWVAVNHPTGDPINDNPQVPLLFAIDLAAPLQSAASNAKVMNWVKEFITKGDVFYGSLSGHDGRLRNNWQSWRLGIRALCAVILQDSAYVESTKVLLAAHLLRNINADGSTIDFVTRDALHYHIYDLMPLVEVATLAPQILSTDELAAVANALRFIKPFYTGDKQHIEFLHTVIPFDIERKNAGEADFQNVIWKAPNARHLLRWARANFPEIRSWIENLVDEDYHPIEKAIFALHE